MTLPPYAAFLGVELAPGDEAAQLTLPFGEDVIGRPGFVHGGALAGLLELAAITAIVQALAQAGRGEAAFKPINLTVDYMRGARDRPTHAVGRVSRLGSRIANVEAIAWQDERERPVAAARINFLISDSALA